MFTQENKRIFSLILALQRAEALGNAAHELRATERYLAALREEGETLHDQFGFHKIETSLEASLLAAQAVGLKGRILLAEVLRAVATTPARIEKAEQIFGKDMGKVLRAFLKVKELLSTQTAAMQTDDFRNLLVAQSGDMRVVLMLIADCVTMMRRLKDTPLTDQRASIAKEAAHIFAPLAHKLGLYQLKSELEDLSLKYLETDAYYYIKERLNATKKSRDAYIERFINPLKERLDAEGLHYHIKGRTKSIHSIWQKMKKQRCDFDGVYDLFAIRVIIDAPLAQEKAQCWKVFSIITYKYESNLKRLRDWLTVPKSNGYESLHITVLGPENKWVEVQIRTERMDDIAEHGLAAHWRYKGVKASQGGVEDWLANIRAALEQGDEEQLKNSLQSSPAEQVIYVFSPKGDLYKLPKGATVLDFAYLIHTTIGNRCVGARIDGKNVPLRYELSNGQKVEIATSNTQTPKAEWLNMVVGARTKGKIRSALNDLQAEQADLAREILERKLRNRKVEWVESVWNRLIVKMGYKETNEFYKDLNSEKLDATQVVEQYIKAYEKAKKPQDRLPLQRADEFDMEKELPPTVVGGSDVLVIGPDLKGIDFAMARCCSPVYGDEVFGFVTNGGGIKVHRASCPNAPALRTRFPYRVVKAKWAGKGAGKYPITLQVVGNDDLGIVNNITGVISKYDSILLRSISIDTHDGLFSGILTLMVDNTEMLNALMKKIRTIKGVKAVSRT